MLACLKVSTTISVDCVEKCENMCVCVCGKKSHVFLCADADTDKMLAKDTDYEQICMRMCVSVCVCGCV